MNTELMKKYGGYCIIDEERFLQRRSNLFDTNLPLIITDYSNEDKINEKIKYIFGNTEIQKEDRSIIVYPADFFEKTQYSFGDLVEIIHRLRDDDGCMWDKAQTNMSIRANAIEEAYELVEAVELDNFDKMKEEFGDVLLQGVFNSIISEDENKFGANEVITGLCQKLINRHTHIFGTDKAATKEDALKCWEQAKAKEKHQKTALDKINDVPVTFNALMKAYKVQKIIKKTGFDFADINDAISKIYEEVEEFVTADESHKESEGGDMLFAVVNVLRMANVDPETALMGTTNRFIERFRYIVEQANKSGRRVEELSLEEMEKYYNEYKRLSAIK